MNLGRFGIVSITGKTRRPFHVMAKPTGPTCNLACRYCFYREKEQLYGDGQKYRMSDDVLTEYVRQYIASQDTLEVGFAWQGGEPTMMGLEFFRRAMELQQEYADGKKISNSIQTNGTLLDDAWCEFFAEHEFLVGLSIDGPAELHDAYRVDRGDQPTHAAVVRAAELLIEHGAQFNTLSSVARRNSEHPLQVYRFLKEIGSEFMQFIPIVERLPDQRAAELGLSLAAPPDPAREDDAQVTPWSVRPEQYGEFLVEIFEEWVGRDVGRVFVQLFDVALGAWVGQPGSVCVFAETCGNALIIEHDGAVYACDHYVYPEYLLGNIGESSLDELANRESQLEFGTAKSDTLPSYCRRCEFRFACHGDCPKHRFATTPDGEPGLSFLCPAYKRFFDHVDPYMRTMAQLLAAGRPAADIVGILDEHERRQKMETTGRNDPCPCGSGRKFKRCCGASASGT
jgi:uncharacterized protein